MTAPLKFKPYVPLPQRQRKKKHPDLAPKERRHGATSLETCGEGQYARHNAEEGLLGINDQRDVTALNWSSHDWCDGVSFVSHRMNMCRTSNAADEEVDEHLSSALNPAAQLAAGNPEPISGFIVRVEDVQEGDSKATQRSPRLMDPTTPAAVMGPTVDFADDNLIQTSFTWPKAGTAKQSVDLSRLGVDQLRGPHYSSLSSPGSSTSAPALANAESLPLTCHLNDEGFQHWLDASQQHVTAPTSNRTERLLGDSHHSSGADDPLETKRPKLPSAAESRNSLHQPGVYDIVSVPVDAGIDAQDQSPRLLQTRRSDGSHDDNLDESRSAMRAPARDPTSGSYPTTAHQGSLISSPASFGFDPSPLSSNQHLSEHNSHLYGDMMTSQPPLDCTQPSLQDGPRSVISFSETQDTGQTGKCKSCAIFRAALFEALPLLLNPLPKDVSVKARRGQPVSNTLRRHYNLRERSTAPESNRRVPTNAESLSPIGENCNGSDDCISGRDDDDPLAKTGKRRALAKRRRWSALEERRLRAWKRENKPESWIASKLNRTVSAVKQQWRKMSE